MVYDADVSRPVVKQGPVLQLPDLVVEVKSPRDTEVIETYQGFLRIEIYKTA